MPEFSKDWFGTHKDVWRSVLKPYKDEAFEYLEIGCYEGMSVLFMLENYKKSKISVIDTFGQTPEYKLLGVCGENYYETFRNNIKGHEDRVSIYMGYSLDVLVDLLQNHTKTYDVIYVDGSHSSRGTLQDMVLSWELLKADGILIIDDYQWDVNVGTIMHPKNGVDGFMKAYKGYYEVIHKGYQVILRKVS